MATPIADASNLVKLTNAAYRDGVRDAVRAFAWSKDGVEYVSSGKFTLKFALDALEEGVMENSLPRYVPHLLLEDQKQTI